MLKPFDHGEGRGPGTPIIWAKAPRPSLLVYKATIWTPILFLSMTPLYGFYTIPERDRQTDGQTEFYLYGKLSEVSEKGSDEISYHL